MRDEPVAIQPFAPGTITECPRCGAEAKGMLMETEYQDVYPLEEMWPGGPVIDATWEGPTRKITGRHITLKPCGDVFRDGIILTTRRTDV
jgi:hypothetical protein